MSARDLDPETGERRRPAHLDPKGLRPVCTNCHRELQADEPRISRGGGWYCQACEYRYQRDHG